MCKKNTTLKTTISQNPRILYIEDDLGIARLFQKKLTAAGYQVDIANSDRDGLAMYDSDRYDILAIDNKIPIHGGLEVIRVLSAQDEKPPMIMITGTGNEKVAVDAMKLGASDYIIKDVDSVFLDLLPHVIDRALCQHTIAKERKIADEKLKLAVQVFENVKEGIMITDSNGLIQSVNPAFSNITGFSPEEVIGKNPYVLRSGHHDNDFYKNMWTSIVDEGHWKGEIWNRRKNGEAFPEHLSITSIQDSEGKRNQYVGVFNDITERKLFEKQLDYLANHDALTNLPNRSLFDDRLHMGIVQAKRNNESLAIMFIDLDNFKTINDTLGHAVGDKVLQAAAERFKSCLRKGDTIARQGGDEFTAILVNISHSKDANIVAQKIIDSLSQAIMVDKHKLFISVSIGISHYPDAGKDSSTLMKNADIALYRAKDLGKNNFQIYIPAMAYRTQKMLELESSLRNALKKNEFLVYYQPFFDLVTEKIIGVKALIRWQHPVLGLVPPLEFISCAEETGLIIPIGEFVLQTACKKIVEWQEKGSPLLRMTISISTRQFAHKDMIKSLTKTLKETGIDPKTIQLEITENTAMRQPGMTVSRFKTLKKMGIKLTICDIGTGDSWIGYMKSFPIDTLKIDKSIIHKNGGNYETNEIPTTIIKLARSLNLKVIAEGVETEKQLNFLRSQQCDEILGHFFSRAIPAEELSKLVKKENCSGYIS